MEKKMNWIQIATLVMCAFLVVTGMRQNRRIYELEEAVDDLRWTLQQELNQVRSDVADRVMDALEEAEAVVADWEVRPLEPDAETKTIRNRVEVRLKEWTSGTVVTLAVNGEEVPLAAESEGVFAGTAALPASQEGAVEMSVVIRDGETTRREDLGAWSNFSMLLPVRLASWGGEQERFEAGILTIGHILFTLEDRDYRQTELAETAVRIYRNGEVVLERSAPIGNHLGGGSDGWGYEVTEPMRVSGCQEGDELRVTAVGVDAYGLGYEFELYGWTVSGGKLTARAPESDLTLFWK